MEFWQNVLRIFDTKMTVPTPYGWFHLLCLGLTVLIAIALCRFCKKPEHPRRLILSIAIIVCLLEVYKQINYSFSYNNGISYDYQWYAFPYQFCSTPMYVGLLAGLTRKGKVHEMACAYLATFAVFAGLCVMLYPVDIYVGTVGVNIQTSICHGSMIFQGIYLLYSGYVKLEHKTILRAAGVFAICVAIAVALNELAYRYGILETETFNMFFISPYCEGTLPVYSLVQAVVPYPWCLLIYIVAFSLAAYLILLIAMGIRRLGGRKQLVSSAAS